MTTMRVTCRSTEMSDGSFSSEEHGSIEADLKSVRVYMRKGGDSWYDFKCPHGHYGLNEAAPSTVDLLLAHGIEYAIIDDSNLDEEATELPFMSKGVFEVYANTFSTSGDNLEAAISRELH